MVVINAEIEILKIKIAYRRKIAMFQNLRRENADEKSEFYVIIERDIPPISKKNAHNFPRQIYFHFSDLKQIHRLSTVESI
jgi:hypothetical protein